MYVPVVLCCANFIQTENKVILSLKLQAEECVGVYAKTLGLD